MYRKTYAVDPLSWAKINNQAIATRARILAWADRPDGLRFPAEIIPDFIESMGITFRTTTDSDDKEGWIDPLKNEFVLHEDVYRAGYLGENRARFTFAHELGHVILHFKQLDKLLNRRNLGGQVMFRGNEIKPFRSAEWQANVFAGSLLIPTNHLRDLEQMGASLTPMSLEGIFSVSNKCATIRLEKYIEREGGLQK